MKIFFVIMTTFLVQVSASTFAQQVTLRNDRISLKQAFDAVRKQTGYTVLYKYEQINKAKPIALYLVNVPLEKAITEILKGQNLEFSIKDKAVIIKRTEPSLLDKIIDRLKAIDVRGKVLDEKGEPLTGATVLIKGTNRSVKTDAYGVFFLSNVNEKDVLVIRYVGYQQREVDAASNMGSLTLTVADEKLEEVSIVSTGYQDIPKERATGSFTTVDHKTLNRGVGINILDRLEGVTSGLLLNRGLPTGSQGNNSKISIRGRSTIFANAEPLIVLNGLPYDGTIEQINASDIETINILKDAAASSIWGTRSGNGVIVITTKSGSKNQKLAIGASSIVMIGNKPNLNYLPHIASSEFVGLEEYLFNKGLYNFRFFQPYNAVSAAVEIFNQRKNNLISSPDSASRIDGLKRVDVRSQLQKFAYRQQILQQHQVSLSGGSGDHTYYLSGGYDNNLENKVTNNYDRLTLNVNNTFSLIKNRMTITGDISIVSSNTNRNSNPYMPYSPYDKIVDETGKSLPTVKDFRMSYVDTAGRGHLLDWYYRPKDELISNSKARLDQYRSNLIVNLKLFDGLSLNANYQYLNEQSKEYTNDKLNSYTTRNLINTYSSLSGGVVKRVIPLGDIYAQNFRSLSSKIFRGQLNYKKTLLSGHEINAIAGYEGSDSRIGTNGQTYYGYNEETLTNSNSSIDPGNYYQYYYQPFFSGLIQTSPNSGEFININQSFYFNVSYTFKSKYTFSGSARRDESNLFGVKTNQKGVPLWSSGLAWNINNEDFYHAGWLPSLKLRLTYGFNGNVDKSLSAYLTSLSSGDPDPNFGYQYATIQNPPNPSLKWEQIRTWNLGIDFSTKDNRISGSIDAYKKNAFHLIGNNPIASQTGINFFKGNGADLQAKGVDIILHTRNLVDKFQWNTTFLLNLNTEKVTNYKVKQSSNLDLVNQNFQNPLEGYPYNSIFSFPSAGLDAMGDPQGYLNGVLSKDYSSILNQLDPSQIKYSGSASPRISGSIINTLCYKAFELSFNISYKFDYFFRRAKVFSGSNYGSAISTIYELSDFDNRWKIPGDELKTNIPALLYPSNFARDAFFQFSDKLVEPGDHIRLQDIRLSYQLSNFRKRFFFKGADIFVYTRNIGIIWRKNDLNIDPDYGTTVIPQPFATSLGIKLTL